MNQRELILAAWQKHKASRAPSKKMQMAEEFFGYVEEHPEFCWIQLSKEFRSNYYEAFDEIVPVLMETDDPFVVHNLVRFADLDEEKEVDAAKDLATNVDPKRHEVTMARLAGNKNEKISGAVKKRPQLPDSVKARIAKKEQ